MRRPFGVEISDYDRMRARQALRDPMRDWRFPEVAKNFYAACIATAVVRGQKPAGQWLYAYAVAARLHDVQVRRAFPPKPVPQ